MGTGLKAEPLAVLLSCASKGVPVKVPFRVPPSLQGYMGCLSIAGETKKDMGFVRNRPPSQIYLSLFVVGTPSLLPLSLL